MKYSANCITIARIILSGLLICLLNDKPIFLVLYCICGASDILDGIIARKTHTQSTMGAKLDSIADCLMFGVTVLSLAAWAGEELKSFLPYIFIIVLIRFFNVLFAAHKYHSFIMLHTWGNKITGLLVFMTPVIFAETHHTGVFIFVCAAAVLSALEEGMIHMTSTMPDLNRRSIFLK